MRSCFPADTPAGWAAAFAVIGIGGAMLTASWSTPRFRPAYRLSHESAASRRISWCAGRPRLPRNGGWNPQSLNQLAPTVTMTGSEAEVATPRPIDVVAGRRRR